MRRWSTFLIGFTLAGLLAACGSTGGSSAGNAARGGDIVIGASLSLTGATPLPALKDGYQAAVDDINAAGGLTVGGSKRKMKLVVLDNRSDLNTMTSQVRTLVLQDNAVALVGNCCQYNINLAALADALQVPTVMGALPVELMPPGKGYAHLAFQSLADATTQFFQLTGKAPTNKKIVFVGNNDAQSKATLQQWQAAGHAQGYNVVTSGAVPTGTTDFSDVIGKAKAADAQILIASMIPPDCFALWKQMKALAFKPKVAIGLQCAQTPGWQQLGGVGDGTIAVMNWSPTSGLPQAAMIESRFQAKYPNLADLSAVPIGYAELTVLAKAIEAAGSTDRQKVNDALKTIKVDTTLGEVGFDPQGRSKTPTYLGQWSGGKLGQVWPASAGGATFVPTVTGLQ